jgi:hypothetical protein
MHLEGMCYLCDDSGKRVCQWPCMRALQGLVFYNFRKHLLARAHIVVIISVPARQPAKELYTSGVPLINTNIPMLQYCGCMYVCTLQWYVCMYAPMLWV